MPKLRQRKRQHKKEDGDMNSKKEKPKRKQDANRDVCSAQQSSPNPPASGADLEETKELDKWRKCQECGDNCFNFFESMIGGERSGRFFCLGCLMKIGKKMGIEIDEEGTGAKGRATSIIPPSITDAAMKPANPAPSIMKEIEDALHAVGKAPEIGIIKIDAETRDAIKNDPHYKRMFGTPAPSPLRCRGKEKWDISGKMGTVLGEAIFVKQFWTPVLWDGEEDPDFVKTAGIELLKNPAPSICKTCGQDKNRPVKPIILDNNPLSVALYLDEKCVECGRIPDEPPAPQPSVLTEDDFWDIREKAEPKDIDYNKQPYTFHSKFEKNLFRLTEALMREKCKAEMDALRKENDEAREALQELGNGYQKVHKGFLDRGTVLREAIPKMPDLIMREKMQQVTDATLKSVMDGWGEINERIKKSEEKDTRIRELSDARDELALGRAVLLKKIKELEQERDELKRRLKK